MDYQHILFEAVQGVARLTLNRPDKLNSFIGAMHVELRHALDIVQSDASIRVLVITGAGRAFCAGQDLADPDMVIGTAPPDIGDVVEQNYKPLSLRLQNLRVPTVAMVNGVAAGAGASLALACDLVLAGKSARFIQAFIKIGLVPDAGGTFFLPRLVGEARAKAMALLGEPVTGEQAEAWGLIYKAVDDAALMDEAEALTAHLALQPTQAIARIKQAFLASGENDLATQLDLERELQQASGGTADFREGVRAFREKRAPVFTGRA